MSDATSTKPDSAHVSGEPVEPATRHLIVVADRFSGFRRDDRVKTVSDLCALIASGALDEEPGEVLLHAGQGITAYERRDIEGTLGRRGLEHRVRLVYDDLEPAGRGIVHKHRSENVLLTNLRREGDHDFRAQLCVHGHNELLLDHQTGEHVQGMVIVEAARQMFLAAFEIGYRHRWPLRSYYVVWNSVSLTFENFLFPLPAEVTCTLRGLKIDDPSKLDYEMHVSIHQFGRRVTGGVIGFTSFDTERISAIERWRARQALDACIERVASQPAGRGGDVVSVAR
jgi:hypothetical protein